MKTYIGTKIVKAWPALRVTTPDGKHEYTEVGDIIHPNAKAEEGYRVRYKDGYLSWSPKAVFEEVYREIQTFELNKPKAMLSQPMGGKTDEEIAAAREKAIAALEAQGYQVANTLFTDEWYSKESMESRGVAQIPLCFLAKSLENMSLCHAAYFCKGWESARGCRIEHAAAEAYGLEIIYEEESVYAKE